MAKIGHLLRQGGEAESEDLLTTTICPFKKHKGTTWRQVLNIDPDYVHFILYNTDLELDEDLVQELEWALEEMQI